MATALRAKQIPSIYIDAHAMHKITSTSRWLRERRGAPGNDIERLLHADFVAEEIRECAPAAVALVEELRRPHGPEAIALHMGTGSLDEHTAEILALAICGAVGLEPFQYSQQNEGKLVARVRPMASAPANTNATADNFGDHSDDQTVPIEYRAEYISLLGVRNDGNTATAYTPVSAWISELTAAELNCLTDPDRYLKRWPLSFGFGERWSNSGPILHLNCRQEPCIALASYGVKPASDKDAEAKATLDQVIRLIGARRCYVTVAPGTVLIFNNLRGTHCRDAIAGNRLVLRTYWRPELSALRSTTGQNGHVFDLKTIENGAMR
jgi:hypothetical protein